MNIYSRNIFVIMLTLSMWHVAFAASPLESEGITEQQILSGLKAQDDALARGDVAAFLSLLADDYNYTLEQPLPTGNKLTKMARGEVEAGLAKNLSKYSNRQISHTDIKISISQDERSATVTHKSIDKFTYDDKRYKMISLNTRTFGLQDGKMTLTSGADLIQKAQAFSSASKFMRGKARLTCRSLTCKASAAWNGNVINDLNKNGKWQELADKVIDIGYTSNVFYLFLGVAAENLGGNVEAAKIYYNLAIDKDSICDDELNCGEGGTVHKDVSRLLARIEAERLAEADELPARIEEVEAKRLAKVAAEEERFAKAAEAERRAKIAEAVRLAKAAEAERLAKEERAAAKKAAAAKRLKEL